MPTGPSLADGFAALRRDREATCRRQDTPSAVQRCSKGRSKRWWPGALATDAPFRERLVWFWANHFTVSLRAGRIAALAGDYLRSAIRPHVTGRFGDMLLAVMRHPAMLIYLDNAGSFGPDSAAGLRQGKGLNENLARECLELHTVSPAAGYTQADVTSFARLLTGWSVANGDRSRPASASGPCTSRASRRCWAAVPGRRGGRASALAFLADHPATHRHLATKLVQHFVADDPPPADGQRIEGVLRDTRGDLGQPRRRWSRCPAPGGR